ncbi:MAG TPA: hypothetical protein VHW70_01360, partial [Edaphobacter sp.]|nr:hypothetical protein [Edaphobacter sp.]
EESTPPDMATAIVLVGSMDIFLVSSLLFQHSLNAWSSCRVLAKLTLFSVLLQPTPLHSPHPGDFPLY